MDGSVGAVGGFRGFGRAETGGLRACVVGIRSVGWTAL